MSKISGPALTTHHVITDVVVIPGSARDNGSDVTVEDLLRDEDMQEDQYQASPTYPENDAVKDELIENTAEGDSKERSEEHQSEERERHNGRRMKDDFGRW